MAKEKLEEPKEHTGNFLALQKVADEIDALTKTTVDTLASRGWFIWFGEGSFKVDYASKHKGLIGVSCADQDAYMIDYVKTNICKFEQELILRYSNRHEQIQGAFKAHDAKLYYASIPVLLSLSEGIGRDLVGIGIYEKNKRTKRPELNKKFSGLIQKGVEQHELFWLSPLNESTYITTSGKNLSPAQKAQFNRHWILHGNSDAYGSEENSLKAISLVYFVHKSISRLKDILAGNI